MKTFGKYAKGALAYVDLSLLTNEVASTLIAYDKVSEKQIANLKEIRGMINDKETIDAIDEIIADIERSGIKGIQDYLKTLAIKETDILADMALEALLGPYSALYKSAQLISNAITNAGSKYQASHYILRLLESNLDAANVMLDKYEAFYNNPTDETLQSFCCSIGYYLTSTENCIHLGTLANTTEMVNPTITAVFVPRLSNSKKQEEIEKKELETLESLRVFYNKYRTR